jgi:uncharacterized membrane protein
MLNLMKNKRKTMILLIALLSIAFFVTLYSICAYSVAIHVFEESEILYWPTPGYALTPWPTTPTGVMIQVIEPLNQTDILYYQYVIGSGVLIVLMFLLWFAVSWGVYRIRKLPS